MNHKSRWKGGIMLLDLAHNTGVLSVTEMNAVKHSWRSRHVVSQCAETTASCARFFAHMCDELCNNVFETWETCRLHQTAAMHFVRRKKELNSCCVSSCVTPRWNQSVRLHDVCLHRGRFCCSRSAHYNRRTHSEAKVRFTECFYMLLHQQDFDWAFRVFT